MVIFREYHHPARDGHMLGKIQNNIAVVIGKGHADGRPRGFFCPVFFVGFRNGNFVLYGLQDDFGEIDQKNSINLIGK